MSNSCKLSFPVTSQCDSENYVCFHKQIIMASNKENTNCDETKHRSRGDNWSQEEKDLFLEIMQQSAPIVENKLTDTNTNKRKNLEWQKIQSKLKELTGKSRDISQLKGFWRRSKLAAKKSVSLHRRALKATGGGQMPPSPPPRDLKILDLCPTDFIIEENKFDSDAVSTKVQDNAAIIIDEELHNSTIYDMDIHEDIGDDNSAEVSFVNEIVTVADVHNHEIDIKSCGGDERTDTKFVQPPKIISMGKKLLKEKQSKYDTSKAALFGTSIAMKKQAMQLMEEEYAMKINFQRQELAHQQLRQKLEVDILLLEKEKKKLEIEILKKKLQD